MIRAMTRVIAIELVLLIGICRVSSAQLLPASVNFDYQTAMMHELKPHRRIIPLQGVGGGFNQLRLTVKVSALGNVTSVEAVGSTESMKFWPQVQGEVLRWKFTPFEQGGTAVSAEIEEYIDLVPPERLPVRHIAAPSFRSDSRISITLEKSGCYGSCPSYNVSVNSDRIIFEGHGYVAVKGKHGDSIDPEAVRRLANKFVDADFYSFDARYAASVTDSATFRLSIDIDGQSKAVVDYLGQYVGMPAIVAELEDDVDALARTNRWIKGAEGLVATLKADGFSFQTLEAQVILRECAKRGQTATVRELLAAGVPITPIFSQKVNDSFKEISFEDVGWLTAASRNPETLQVLLDAGASKRDQNDKNRALAGASEEGNLSSVRALIRYGANPNTDLSKLRMTIEGGGMVVQERGAGSMLIYAAGSGNPAVIREILKYHPSLEKRDYEGKTALFAAASWSPGNKDDSRVECVRLLVQAGATVNARDKHGNTPLHETFLTDVEEELLKLGADVNARNRDGETPIFTTVDEDAIPLFIRYGANLGIRNKMGQTVLEAAKEKGPIREETLRKAIEERKRR
jgi:ankyrin repeat protein